MFVFALVFLSTCHDVPFIKKKKKSVAFCLYRETAAAKVGDITLGPYCDFNHISINCSALYAVVPFAGPIQTDLNLKRTFLSVFSCHAVHFRYQIH